jgi:hypothetical protein
MAYRQNHLRDEGPASGVSFALNGDGIVGLDLDDCRDPATKAIDSWAEQIIRRLRSYTEVSPSGTGLRIFVRGELPPEGRHKGQIEVYDTGKFLSVTGLKLTTHGAGDGIEDRAAAVLAWHAEVFGDGTGSTPTGPTEENTKGRTRLVIPPRDSISPFEDSRDDRLYRLFEAKPKASDLFWGGRDGYASQSEVDLALANMAVSIGWSDQDLVDLLVVARRNADAGDKPHDYFIRTIDKARDGRTGPTPRPKPKPQPPPEPAPEDAHPDPPAAGETVPSPDEEKRGGGAAPDIPGGSGRSGSTRTARARDGRGPTDHEHGRSGRPGRSGRSGRSAGNENGRSGRPGRSGRSARRESGLLAKVSAYLALHLVVDEPALIVMSAWVMAAWLIERWERFAHLAVTSPEARCGKTRALELLEPICPNGKLLAGITPAAVYRLMAAQWPRPTLLLDEAQALGRDGSEKLLDLFKAGISRSSTHSCCVREGKDWKSCDFPVYGPKVIALIGKPEGVLADRCFEVPMRRKNKDESGRVRRCRPGVVEKHGRALRERLEKWSAGPCCSFRVPEIYERLEPLDLDNDRLAELLLPLQAVLLAEKQTEAMRVLESYARGIEERAREAEEQSPGVRLLAALRAIFADAGEDFLPTERLLRELVGRGEEDWATCDHGRPLNRHTLAARLRKFDIRPDLDRTRTVRGYYAADFEDAWGRYLPHPSQGSSRSSRSSRSSANGGG